MLLIKVAKTAGHQRCLVARRQYVRQILKAIEIWLAGQRAEGGKNENVQEARLALADCRLIRILEVRIHPSG
jgi:hypothetical protein